MTCQYMSDDLKMYSKFIQVFRNYYTIVVFDIGTRFKKDMLQYGTPWYSVGPYVAQIFNALKY